MTGRLRIYLEPLAHPYSHEAPSRFEQWGRIVVAVMPGGEDERVLLHTEWNLEVFADWFADHGRPLSEEDLLIAGQGPLPGESIAQAKQRMASEWVEQEETGLADPDDIFNRFTASDAYHERHSLREASCGLDMPPMYIGVNHGTGEISVALDAETWSYTFDMRDFCQDFHQRLVALIEGWMQEASDDDVRQFAVRLLHRLREGQLQHN